ncbi:MAG: NAD-dependent epimerase/dehydratase family protein [Candidatus Lokiarchaeota archaeon]|nr:NAD-dependent epimerase/dehydratase family protein [Candidatus Lokiarchaeota archaeon]MBD3201332.1 NAD-dependent epimerase/dehydratase family protein [Candidatus Lokiarchaeota archaeon]
MGKILITGADGFIGSHLTDFYLNRNENVVALKKPHLSVFNLLHYTDEKDYFPPKDLQDFEGFKIQIPTNNDKLDIFECDLNDKYLTTNIIQQLQPNYIFHFGAQPNVLESWKDPNYTIKTNVLGTINIFEALKDSSHSCKVIVACSSAEYGITTMNLNRALKESDPLKAIHPYGISKVAAELIAFQYFLNFNIDSIVLRFFNQTGPRKINDACSDFIRKIAQIEAGLTKPVIEVGNLDSYRDILGIKNSLQAIDLVKEKGKVGDTYNICSNRKIYIRNVLETALELSTKKIEVIENVPKKLRKTDEDVILGDNTKIKDLGFKVTQSIEELLKEMFDYWLEIYKKQK